MSTVLLVFLCIFLYCASMACGAMAMWFFMKTLILHKFDFNKKPAPEEPKRDNEEEFGIEEKNHDGVQA